MYINYASCMFMMHIGYTKKCIPNMQAECWTDSNCYVVRKLTNFGCLQIFEVVSAEASLVEILDCLIFKPAFKGRIRNLVKPETALKPVCS